MSREEVGVMVGTEDREHRVVCILEDDFDKADGMEILWKAYMDCKLKLAEKLEAEKLERRGGK